MISAFYSGGLLYIDQGFLGLIYTIQAMQSLLAFHRKPNADFVLIFSSIPDYRVNTCPNFLAVVNRVHIIQKQFVKPITQYISQCLANTNSSSTFDVRSVSIYRRVKSEWFPLVQCLFFSDSECFSVIRWVNNFLSMYKSVNTYSKGSTWR